MYLLTRVSREELTPQGPHPRRPLAPDDACPTTNNLIALHSTFSTPLPTCYSTLGGKAGQGLLWFFTDVESKSWEGPNSLFLGVFRKRVSEKRRHSLYPLFLVPDPQPWPICLCGEVARGGGWLV